MLKLNNKNKHKSRKNKDYESKAEIKPLEDLPGSPIILKRDSHSLSRKFLDKEALKVMYRLINHGHYAFLVGGAVRDILLGKRPKDFDIGTSATPDEVRKIFKNSRVIGKRFKLNHVYFYGGKIYEVATFRKSTEREEDELEQPIKTDNEYGDAQTDAFRRDLTINGLFYDPHTFSIIDYVGGLEDLEKQVVRIIGEPDIRFKEDPVRIIRALRHAARAGFSVEAKTYDSLCNCNDLLTQASPARIFEEISKDLFGAHALSSFRLYKQSGVLKSYLPFLDELSQSEKTWKKIEGVFRRLDALTKKDFQPSVAVVYLSLLVGKIEKDLILEKLQAGQKGEILTSIENCFFPLDVKESKLVIENSHLREPKVEITTKDGQTKKKKQISDMHRALSKLFKLFSVSKKDTELAAKILKIYIKLSEIEPGSHKAKELLSRPYFSDVLDFCYLISSKKSKELREIWSKELLSTMNQ